MTQYFAIWLHLKTDRRAITNLEYCLFASIVVLSVVAGFNLLANDDSTRLFTVIR